jgi:hypothetical protein
MCYLGVLYKVQLTFSLYGAYLHAKKAADTRVMKLLI